jgi:MIP family channel proteins
MSVLIRRATAEAFGTFGLVFFGAGAVVMQSYPDARYGILGIALIHAVVLAIVVSATMGISGGHVNPAVTIGLLLVRRIDAATAGVHVAAQLAGAAAAAWVVTQLLPANVGVLSNWGTPMVTSQLTFGGAIALEALGTFFLMSAVMGTVVARNAPKIGGFGVGLTLVFVVMVIGPLTGAAVNPARAFGPALLTGVWTAQAVWWIGPIVGAGLAALLWEKVLLREGESPES